MLVDMSQILGEATAESPEKKEKKKKKKKKKTKKKTSQTRRNYEEVNLAGQKRKRCRKCGGRKNRGN